MLNIFEDISTFSNLLWNTNWKEREIYRSKKLHPPLEPVGSIFFGLGPDWLKFLDPEPDPTYWIFSDPENQKFWTRTRTRVYPTGSTHHHIIDRDRNCHGNIRNRVRYTGVTRVYCGISMKHYWIEGTCALSFRTHCNILPLRSFIISI